MLPKNNYAQLIEECKKSFALYGHHIRVPNEFIDPISNEIMEIPIALDNNTERFDQRVLLQVSGDINIMNKTLINPITHERVASFHIDEDLRKKISTFVKGIAILAKEFKAKYAAEHAVT